MKTQIRRCVFETNSSSCHSLSVVGSPKMLTSIDMPFGCSDGKFTVSRGEYGWGYEELDTPMEKLSYIATAYQEGDSRLENAREAVRQVVGREFDIVSSGYIDHQSYGNMDRHLETVGDAIRFIFDASHTVIIDNDNW